MQRRAEAERGIEEDPMINMFPPRLSAQDARSRLDASRWAALSKAAAALAVDEGQLSPGEACRLYAMDQNELEVWQRVVSDRGLRRILAGKLDR